ncbi:cupin domain-containing protein [Calycomorphotria hydatis]|uniref:Quercetin 2,3-dioxygenase n=1 Tax=Calycomorphotria hydatis TaxID=2528027 RepID=A0A517T6J1_9PLAN|nr:cupin domain-containing protein [Calycomorphotria hydatis]QDT63994.1 Quercetin 2,3-dioxygenase [Calycomorphotria hydatis]
MQPTVLGPDDGPVYKVLGGDVIRVLASKEDTGQVYTLFETIVPSGAGPMRHVHRREDESFYVMEGEFDFFVGEEEVHAVPGSFLIGPRDIPHHFRCTSEIPGKLLIVITPGGFENFIAELAKLPLNEPPDPVEIGSLFEKYGLEFV